MKFYTTVLVAVLLFGLCFLERKAKEEMIMKNMLQKRALMTGKEGMSGSLVSSVANASNTLVETDSLIQIDKQPAKLLVDFSVQGAAFSGR